jgi:hypothetical protein
MRGKKNPAGAGGAAPGARHSSSPKSATNNLTPTATQAAAAPFGGRRWQVVVGLTCEVSLLRPRALCEGGAP